MKTKTDTENLDEILEFARIQEDPEEVFKQYQFYRSKILRTETQNYGEFIQDKHDIALEMVRKFYAGKRIYELP